MSYPNPDIESLPHPRSIIRSLPPNIRIETLQDELYKQGFAVIPSEITSVHKLYIPSESNVKAPSVSNYPKEEHPKKQKKSKCEIQ